MQRINLMAQRDVAPAKTRCAHIDRRQPVIACFRGKHPATGLDAGVMGFVFFHEEPGDAAGCVSTGTCFTTIGIVNTHKGVRSRAVFSSFHDDNLIASHTGAP